LLQVVGPAAAATRVATVPDANFTVARTDAAQSFTGDQTLSTGNLVIGTSGKGVDFSATSGTGTSELLADYEEGTWTPNQGAALTVVGAFSSSGTYTKVGNLVYVSGIISGATSIAVTSIGNISTNLPFTVKAGAPSIGTVTTPATLTSFTGCYSNPTTTSLLSVNTVAATTSIEFSIVYLA
jgi:hypothetical protein